MMKRMKIPSQKPLCGHLSLRLATRCTPSRSADDIFVLCVVLKGGKKQNERCEPRRGIVLVAARSSFGEEIEVWVSSDGLGPLPHLRRCY